MAASDADQDAAAFVAAAEAATNAGDAAAAAALYAANAVLEVITDGAVQRFEGRAAIAEAWRAFFQALTASDFRLRKELTAARANVIVNEWTGSLKGHAAARAIAMRETQLANRRLACPECRGQWRRYSAQA